MQLYPYASVYLGPEGMLGGEARDRVAGFWRALGLTPPAEPDHVGALLALFAALAADPAPQARRARHALLWEHLLSWLPAWLAKLDEVAPGPYRAWAGLLREALLDQAVELGPPFSLPAHLREAPHLEDPRRGGARRLVAGVLAPARSGLILTRSDLGRAARELGLGLRHGERAFVLEALLAQDSPATLGWLAAEAERWVEIHGSAPPAWLPVTRAWSARAGAARALLTELGAEAAVSSRGAGPGLAAPGS